MKVAYIISPKAKNQYAGDLELIYKIIEKLGHVHMIDVVKTVDPTDFYTSDSKQAKKFFNNVKKCLTDADICVFETTVQSLGLGHLIYMAISLNKPIIVLYQGDNHPMLLPEIDNKKVQIEQYTRANVRDVLVDALDAAKGMVDVRFNMLFSQHHMNFLKSKSSISKISVAGLLRQMIEKEIAIDGESSISEAGAVEEKELE